MSRLLTEFVSASRLLFRAPGFSVLAIAMLALGIGANVAIFSLFHSIVVRPLPYPQSERLVGVRSLNPTRGLAQPALSLADFRDFKAQAQSYAVLAAFRPDFVGYVPRGGDPVQLISGRVTEEFFDAFGVPPLLGRAFTREEFSFSSARTAILSHSTWRRHFDQRADTVGSVVQLDDEPTTIVGIMPEHFREPEFADVWLPFPVEAPENLVRDSRYWATVGRLKPDASIDRARAEAITLAASLARDYPGTNRGWSMDVLPWLELRIAGARSSLLALLGAAGLVLLIACVNLANLMLARGVSRWSELAVRLALGATPRTLMRSAIFESVILALLGGAAGVAVAALVLRVVALKLPAGLVPRSAELGFDATTLVFAISISAATGLVFGLLPAWQVGRANVNEMLKSGGRGASGRFTRRVQGASIVGQVALTLVVLTAAGLLLKSLLLLQRTAPGFDPRHVLALRISPPQSRWAGIRELGDYYERLMAEVRREPGVESVALNCSAPLCGITMRYPFSVEGRPTEEGEPDEAVFNSVGTDYFKTMRIPVQRGRGFEDRDDARAGASRPVCVINATLAKRLFGDADPLGRRIRTMPWMLPGYREIVGVVADVKQETQADEPVAQLYVPQQQTPWFFTTLLVRTRGATPGAVQAAMRRADPTLTMSVQTMEDAIAQTAANPRIRALLFGAFGVAALGLSAFGIYASVAFTTRQRTREIGVRVALGATPQRIVCWVLARAAGLSAAGVAVGVVGAFGAMRWLRGALYRVTPLDPLVVGGLALFLPLVAVVAAFFPARRAARMEPRQALDRE
jgi:predicted permease